MFVEVLKNSITALIPVAILAAGWLGGIARAQTSVPDEQAPPPSLKTPFAGALQSFDMDAKGRLAVSTSLSRAFTLWDIGRGERGSQLMRPTTIRIPPRKKSDFPQASEIKEYALARYLSAISPDGRFVAISTPPVEVDNAAYATA